MANTTLGYESSHTGSQIDAAVAAVLGGSGNPSLNERLTDAETAITSQNTTIASLSTRMTEVEENIGTLEELPQEMTDFESGVNTLLRDWQVRDVLASSFLNVNSGSGISSQPANIYRFPVGRDNTNKAYRGYRIRSFRFRGVPLLLIHSVSS